MLLRFIEDLESHPSTLLDCTNNIEFFKLVLQAVVGKDEAPKLSIKCDKNADYSKDETAKHNKPSDLWLIYDSKVIINRLCKLIKGRLWIV